MYRLHFGRLPVCGTVILASNDGSEVIPFGTKVERVADQFRSLGGIVWMPEEETGGFLLFSDLESERVYRFRESGGIISFGAISVYRSQTAALALALEMGSNLLVSRWVPITGAVGMGETCKWEWN